MRIHNTARFGVKPESLDRAVGAIREFVDHVAASEPGTLFYVSLQESKDPTRFIHVMAFEDEAAEHVHANSEWVKQFTDVLYPETIDGVEFASHTRVASAGLPR